MVLYLTVELYSISINKVVCLATICYDELSANKGAYFSLFKNNKMQLTESNEIFRIKFYFNKFIWIYKFKNDNGCEWCVIHADEAFWNSKIIM